MPFPVPVPEYPRQPSGVRSRDTAQSLRGHLETRKPFFERLESGGILGDRHLQGRPIEVDPDPLDIRLAVRSEGWNPVGQRRGLRPGRGRLPHGTARRQPEDHDRQDRRLQNPKSSSVHRCLLAESYTHEWSYNRPTPETAATDVIRQSTRRQSPQGARHAAERVGETDVRGPEFPRTRQHVLRNHRRRADGPRWRRAIRIGAVSTTRAQDGLHGPTAARLRVCGTGAVCVRRTRSAPGWIRVWRSLDRLLPNDLRNEGANDFHTSIDPAVASRARWSRRVVGWDRSRKPGVTR